MKPSSRTFTDHFAKVATTYASHRPTYPSELFGWLARIAPARELAWDCATGTGQAATALADHFAQVWATDASAAQIEAFPFAELPPPPFAMSVDWNLEDLNGYLRSWSATSRYRELHGADPVIPLAGQLAPLWGAERRRVVWPLSIKAGRAR